ncbi:MAG TPA: PDDEXK nuclease domain-containing protein [Candidatus Nanoarchaeia archaeon]|nr:PDDEXK nuclease domain-containing protein [Candidatus Nanoarchaeia archaeon]
MKLQKNNYAFLMNNIGNILEEGRRKAVQSVNQILVQTYWEIGRQIIEYEQEGREKAEYGSALLNNLSKDLSLRYGKGFSKSNIYLMRQFYTAYPIFQTVSGKLSWSHLIELLSIEDDLARRFYERQCVNDRWSIRELRRQINTALFHRLALSKDKKGVLELSSKGHIVEKNEDIIKDPFILEFLKIPEQHKYSEKELEQKIIDNLQSFLLELGKGFSFVGRQHRITLDNNHYYVDLVFYHRALRCFVLIDLKKGKVSHEDIGQMNLYLNYFKKEENAENPPIGIVLGSEKRRLTLEYALGGLENNVFVTKYQLYLPDKEELRERLGRLLVG